MRRKRVPMKRGGPLLPVALLAVCAAVVFPSSWVQAEVVDLTLDDPVVTDAFGVPDVLRDIPIREAEAVDLQAVAIEDAEQAEAGRPPRFAIPREVFITPDTDGAWVTTRRGAMVWRLRVTSPGATSLNLGFTRYHMPEGGTLQVYASDRSHIVRPFTADDNAEHGELWTPIIPADEVVVAVIIPAGSRRELELELTSINVGYRGFDELVDQAVRSGSCNVDVVCPEGDGWEDEIASVGVISTGGSRFCTGFMVNNTAQDETPYFQTAYHCEIRSSNAASLVVYWNYETSTCGGTPDGSLSDFQSGSYLRAEYSTSDFTLVELDEDPDPSWGVAFAGWDRTGADATTAVAIHHPSCDEKRISFEYDSTTVTSYLQTAVPGDGTHIRITDWDVGTTEGGSSGSPLFDQNHHVIGQLHGGYAACGNDSSDWYGRVYTSWNGGGSSSSRLSDWLDPSSTGAASVDTLVPGAGGMKVTPAAGLDSSGPAGGPFTPSSTVYTIENQGSTGINYTVSNGEAWVSLDNTGGYLAGGATATVTVSFNSNADALAVGSYTDTVSFVNTTDHDGDTTRPVSLAVGAASAQYSWNMDSNPGWTTAGQWAWGQPTGDGGDAHGNADPSSGYTGSNVYGYNLSGDYTNSLAETNLTSTAIDCTDLTEVTLKFWRWLNVEQPAYDHAYVRVSNDGSSWTTVWQNTAEVTDSSWSQMEYDISAVADGEATVYLRWTMGTTDGSWLYSGWNIDDVEIWAIGGSPGCDDDSDCDDGLYCNGAETCVGGSCQAGTAIDCDDGVACTDDSCNEATDSCDNVANNANCDNGLWCDGTETCDAVYDCQSGTAVDCDDGVACTDDSCNETTDSCDNVANSAYCSNGVFCDGVEVCDAVYGCQAGTAIDCDDGVACTDDSCNEGTDSCDNIANDANCDNGLWCDGAETCDAVYGCQAGTDPCDDGVSCTDDSCNESTDSCDNVANDANCDNGLWCDGTETCDAVNDCQAGVEPCESGEYCNEETDTCESVECVEDEDCDDDNACTTDTCVDGVCFNECEVTVSSYPYTEGFESGFGDWVNMTGDDMDWTRKSGSTSSSSTGPSAAHGGSYYVYTESSSPNYPSKTALLEGPCFDLANTSEVELTFWYHMYGTSMGTLNVEVSEDCTSWTNVWSLSGNQGNSWYEATVDLTAYVGKTITIRFHGVTGTSYRSDMAVDDITVDVTAAISCTGDAECDDGLFCNGAETCVSNLCQPGSDPCPGQTCDEISDTCVAGPAVKYSWNMDTDPGWTTAGQWAWGQPTGSGGASHGNADPSSGYTGSNVYGYNLSGDYTNNLAETNLTSTAIDCTNLTDVTVKFWRWLNVEQPRYDHAYLRVSNNGSTWTTVWENSAEVTDSAWSQMEYDISAVADGEGTVYLRWTMGTTDSSWLYSGWNVDDVEIWAIGTP